MFEKEFNGQLDMQYLDTQFDLLEETCLPMYPFICISHDVNSAINVG